MISDVAILINSTPPYYPLLPLQEVLHRRYAPTLSWPIFLGTECPEHPLLRKLTINKLALPVSANGFLESRLASLQLLPANIHYVLMLQEDFLLDRSPDYHHLEQALELFRNDQQIASIRLMPCPGPDPTDLPYQLQDGPSTWRVLGPADEYLFTYQATIWRRSVITSFYTELIERLRQQFPQAKSLADRNWLALKMNCAEIALGQDLLRRMTTTSMIHLAWQRQGPWANAVYLCPWPYRPTAIVKGQIMPFARELAQREGVVLEELGGSSARQ